MINRVVLAKFAIIFVALVALSVVIAQMACIWVGPECFRAQRAPLSIIESSKNGTWFAPLGTTLVSSLFLTCALYALSGGRMIRKLPFLNVVIYTIASICIARALLVIPLLYLYPHLRSLFEIAAAIIWFTCGVLLIWAYKSIQSDAS